MSEKKTYFLIKMPNWVGDLVMATPILLDLRSHYPESKIHVLCQSNVAPLLEFNPYIDKIIPVQRTTSWFKFKHLENRSLIHKLRIENYDIGILLTNSFSSAWWFFRSGIPCRIGFKSDLRKYLLSKSLKFPIEKGEEHLVTTYKRLLFPLNIPLSTTQPQLYITPQEKLEAENTLKGYGITPTDRVIGINPGAAYGSAKCWLPERFQQLTDKLLREGSQFIVYFGDIKGAPLVHKICQELGSHVINLAGKTTLRQLMALISCCSVFLTNDSGPMHIAAALKIPLIALFGSTSEVATGPYKHGRVIHKHASCSPCYRRTCPIDFKCMKQIEVSEVYYHIKEFL
jgi:heptosyltransferase-2